MNASKSFYCFSFDEKWMGSVSKKLPGASQPHLPDIDGM